MAYRARQLWQSVPTEIRIIRLLFYKEAINKWHCSRVPVSTAKDTFRT